MGLWEVNETVVKSKINQKELYIAATAPASPTTGQLWYDTSSSPYKLKQWNGSSWIVIFPGHGAEHGDGASDEIAVILDLKALTKVYAVANELVWSNPYERYQDQYGVWTKKKETKLVTILGTLRTKFDLRSSTGAGGTAYGRIYKDGVAFGTERSTTSWDAYVTFSEDLNWGTTWNVLAQLYLKAAGYAAYCQNFNFYGKADAVNQDP